MLDTVTSQPTLSAVVDVSRDFRDFANSYFIADHVAAFDPATGSGKLGWRRTRYPWSLSFNNANATYEKVPGNEWPTTVYAVDPARTASESGPSTGGVGGDFPMQAGRLDGAKSEGGKMTRGARLSFCGGAITVRGRAGEAGCLLNF